MDSTDGIEAGDWLRLWAKTPASSRPAAVPQQAGGAAQEPALRRALLAAAADTKDEGDSKPKADSKAKEDAKPQADAKPKPAAAQEDAGDAKPEKPPKVAAASVQKPGAPAQEEPSLASLLFDEPELQDGLAAALEAQVAAQRNAQKVGGGGGLLGAGAGGGGGRRMGGAAEGCVYACWAPLCPHTAGCRPASTRLLPPTHHPCRCLPRAWTAATPLTATR